MLVSAGRKATAAAMGLPIGESPHAQQKSKDAKREGETVREVAAGGAGGEETVINLPCPSPSLGGEEGIIPKQTGGRAVGKERKKSHPQP